MSCFNKVVMAATGQELIDDTARLADSQEDALNDVEDFELLSSSDIVVLCLVPLAAVVTRHSAEIQQFAWHSM